MRLRPVEEEREGWTGDEAMLFGVKPSAPREHHWRRAPQVLTAR
jgi:hypothetical protein